jgi:hypothetical protein
VAQASTRASAVDSEHHLVTNHLDHATGARGDVLVGDSFEVVDHRGQLVLVELLTDGREIDEVGETHRQRGRGAGCVLRGRRKAQQRGHEVPPPNIAQERLETRRQGRHPADDRFDGCPIGRARGAEGCQAVAAGSDLGFGDTRQRLSDHARQLDHHVRIRALLVGETARGAQHGDVALREEVLVVGNRWKTEGLPQAPQLISAHARLRGNLGGGQFGLTDELSRQRVPRV